METGLLEVMEQVTLYLKEHLPGYTVLKVRKKSYHPDDSHLLHGISEKRRWHICCLDELEPENGKPEPRALRLTK